MHSLVTLIRGSDDDVAALRAAVALAQAVGARLTVVHAVDVDMRAVAAFETAAAGLDAANKNLARAPARAAFKEVCGHIPGCRLLEFDTKAAETVERISPYHDTVVVGRLAAVDGPGAKVFSSALWEAGSAVLVCPPGAPSAVRHVAIAWNGSAQAGRALRAAMPFVGQAERVTVLYRRSGAEDEELKRYLATHEVRSAAFGSYGASGLTARGWGRALLAEVKMLGADLLVMGAYGGRVSNLLGFGRATEKIVTSSSVPVLLSA
ncbi:universal stress protein [Desertibaculum subflavum]|uniref:universal stress protein n=1 Tax=Desertibaculum subflavum TaxID=2268458 RepID=UPI000E6686D9